MSAIGSFWPARGVECPGQQQTYDFSYVFSKSKQIMTIIETRDIFASGSLCSRKSSVLGATLCKPPYMYVLLFLAFVVSSVLSLCLSSFRSASISILMVVDVSVVLHVVIFRLLVLYLIGFVVLYREQPRCPDRKSRTRKTLYFIFS